MRMTNTIAKEMTIAGGTINDHHRPRYIEKALELGALTWQYCDFHQGTRRAPFSPPFRVMAARSSFSETARSIVITDASARPAMNLSGDRPPSAGSEHSGL